METNKKRNNIIVHWNWNFFLSNYYPDIIILNETKLNDFYANNLFKQFVNYNYIHKQRHDKNINTFQVLTNDDMTSDHVPIFIEII
jgi:exonuclease III